MSASEKRQLLGQNDKNTLLVVQGDSERQLVITSSTSQKYSAKDIFDRIGFGKAQLIATPIICLASLSGFSTIQLQPFLSVVIFVNLQLTHAQDSLLSFLPGFACVLGTFYFGYLCDMIGRKRTLLLSVFLLLIFNLLTCVYENYVWITVCRFLVGLSRGTVTISSLYLAEIFPSKYLYLSPIIGQQVAGTVVGETLSIVVAFFLLADNGYPWQYYLIAMSVPMILFIIVAPPLLEETPQYHLDNNDQDKARQIMQRWANENGWQIPDDIHFCARRDKQKKKDREHWKRFWQVLTKPLFLKNFTCIVVINGTGRALCDGLNFVLSQLLYVEGESGDYCGGIQTQTYFLSKLDFFHLILSQIVSVFTVILAVPLMHKGVSTKILSVICFSICVPFILALYFCPKPHIAFAFLTITRVCCQLCNLSATLALVDIIIPSEVRGTMLGLANSLRTAPLPIYSTLTTLLAKYSHHYVTTVNLFFILSGLIAALILPIDYNDGLRDEDENEENGE